MNSYSWKCKALFLASLYCLTKESGIAQQTHAETRANFQGKLLVVACDTDMIPSAYTDGKLGPAVGPDVLTVIRLDQGLVHPPVATVKVSNSVTGPPAALAVTPDGRYAIVIETQGPRPKGKPDATMKDLAVGKKITVVDLTNPDRPRVTQQIESYERAVSVAINDLGNLVAVTFSPDKHTLVPLSLYRFKSGKLSDPVEPMVPGYSTVDSLMDAEFLPGHHVLGLVYNADASPGVATPRLSLVEYKEQQDVITLQPWGNDIQVDPNPYLVKFTRDGNFALVNSMFYDAPGARGVVTSIRLSADGSTVPPRHLVVSRETTGRYPEGLALSPDERWVATANLEDSSLPINDPKQQFYSSLSLLRRDLTSGRLTRVGEFPFDGILPEPIAFDNSSRFIVSASSGRFENPSAGGSIDFWRIVEDNPQANRVELVNLKESIPVSRGPQSMAIVR